MRRAVVIQHLSFENAGTLGTALLEAGFTIDTVQAGTADLAAIDPCDPDLIVVLGAPVGAYDEADYPFLATERRLLAQRLAARCPTLGICLGAQLMAAALGARVYPGPAGKEIGWTPISAVQGVASSPLAALHVPSLSVLHWHGDTFDLPPGALHLASSERYANQAFAVGQHALGLQFHAEVRLAELELWYLGHAAELAQAGISVPRLRAEGQRHAPALESAAPALWRACLEYLLV